MRHAFLLAVLAVMLPGCDDEVAPGAATHTLSLVLHDTGAATGTVDVQGQDACAETSCTYTLPEASITLTPSPGPDSDFVGWGGDCGTASGPATITMDADRSCIATFIPVQRVLTVHAGDGGTVTTDLTGVDCTSGACAATVDHGTTVTLTATAGADHRFVGWSGDGECTGSTSPISVHVIADGSCTATFVERFTITVAAAPPTAGTVVVTADAAGTPSCTGANDACTTDAGADVTVTATPATGFSFVSLEGPGCSGTTSTVTFAAASTFTCTATFAPRRWTLSASAGIGGTVKVTSTSPSAVCATDDACTVDQGQPASITATPDATDVFTGWHGGTNCVGTANPLEIAALIENETCRADFEARVVTLSDVSHVEFTASDYTGTALAFDGQGRLLIAHKPEPGAFVSLSRYDEGTGAWMPLSTAVNERPTRNMLTLEVDSAGVPYVAFVQETEADAGKWELVLKRFNGTSMELAAPVLPLAGARGIDVNQGSMAIDPNDRPVITFTDPNVAVLQVVRLEEGVLVPLATVDLVNDPRLALDTDGTPLVAYLQGFGGSNAAAMRVGRVEDGAVHLLGGDLDSTPNATQNMSHPRVLMRGSEPWAFWVHDGETLAARWDGTDWVRMPFEARVDGGFDIAVALLDGDPILAASRDANVELRRFHDGAWLPGFALNPPRDHLDKLDFAVRGSQVALATSSIFVNAAHVQRIHFP